MYRYVAIVCNTLDAESVAGLRRLRAALISTSDDRAIVYEDDSAVVFQTHGRGRVANSLLLGTSGGVIIGRVFRNPNGTHGSQRVLKFSESETRRILETRGQYLVSEYWGSYVAIVHDDESSEYHVFRDPTANVPCYHARRSHVDIFFSHVEDCAGTVSFSVNREYLIRWLLAGRLMVRECGLEGVEDLPGGECVSINRGRIARHFLWDPAKIARGACEDDPDEAGRTLRNTVQDVIDSWASCYSSVTHLLSGGLDSSIVAGCLAQGARVTDLTFLHLAIESYKDEQVHLPGMDARTESRYRTLVESGDERRFARMVASHCRVPLVERARADQLELSRMWSAPLATSPTGYFAGVQLDDLLIELAKTRGTEAYFSGLAGDTVFFTPTQPLPAIDFAFMHGLSPNLGRHILATAALSGESFWEVLRKTIKHGLLRRPWHSQFSVLQTPTLIRRELVASLSEGDFTDHWSLMAGDLPPGKQYHLGAIAGSTSHDCAFHSQKYAEHVAPLNAQPIWEVMMRTPIYTVLTGGLSRGLARRAFADLIPQEIRTRQGKGTGNPFYQQLVRRNREFLRNHLLDGILISSGYLDRARLEACLSADEPFVAIGAGDLLLYLAAEIWLHCWSNNTGSANHTAGGLTLEAAVS